ncbi:hypothetical protein ACQEVF_59715 [Nonomuraea polychroma]|uniref:hypothetical protein n=1 Tax=Nonomuraea polychroma TaxID=46176 RepID=UPI003D8DFFF2
MNDRPAEPDLTADDLAPGTGFEVIVRPDGTFHVTVFYDWSRRHDSYDGEGVGPTWREAAGRAIADAEGEPYEPPAYVTGEDLAEQHRTGDLR